MHFDKPFAQLTLEEVIKVHLEQGVHGRSLTSDFYIQSTLWVAWCGMRHTTTNDYTKDIMPFLGLFSMLDQVGNAYSRSDVAAYPDANASGIKKALYHFAGYGPNDDATKAIYAFRNGLVHNASMGNEKNGKCYVFRYDYSIPTAVVLSATPWDGKAASITPDKLTLINPNSTALVIQRFHGRFVWMPETSGVAEASAWKQASHLGNSEFATSSCPTSKFEKYPLYS